jgi:hypothetical protein
MTRTGYPGFKRYFKVGPICFDRIGSWDSPAYPRFGAWWWVKKRGFTLRYRAWLLLIGVQG